MRRALLAITLAAIIAGCVSVYIISASPEASMERGDAPMGVSTKVDRNTKP